MATSNPATSKAPYTPPSPVPAPTPHPCTLRKPHLNDVEQRDWSNLACVRGFNETMQFSCVTWPASFYWADASKTQRVDEAEASGTTTFEAWLAANCHVVTFTELGQPRLLDVTIPDKQGPDISWETIHVLLRPGHIIHFHGTVPQWSMGQATRHYAIATGRGDEISQKWYSRAHRARMLDKIEQNAKTGRKDMPAAPSEMPEYPILRDSLEILVNFCTRANQRFLVNRFTVYEVNDIALMMTRDVAQLASH